MQIKRVFTLVIILIGLQVLLGNFFDQNRNVEGVNEWKTKHLVYLNDKSDNFSDHYSNAYNPYAHYKDLLVADGFDNYDRIKPSLETVTLSLIEESIAISSNTEIIDNYLIFLKKELSVLIKKDQDMAMSEVGDLNNALFAAIEYNKKEDTNRLISSLNTIAQKLASNKSTAELKSIP